jgi:hypothetical protein
MMVAKQPQRFVNDSSRSSVQHTHSSIRLIAREGAILLGCKCIPFFRNQTGLSQPGNLQKQQDSQLLPKSG